MHGPLQFTAPLFPLIDHAIVCPEQEICTDTIQGLFKPENDFFLPGMRVNPFPFLLHKIKTVNEHQRSSVVSVASNMS